MEKKWALPISEDKHEGFCVLYVIVVANASSGEKEGKLFLKNLKFRMDSKNALFGFLTICFSRFVNSVAYYVWVGFYLADFDTFFTSDTTRISKVLKPNNICLFVKYSKE